VERKEEDLELKPWGRESIMCSNCFAWTEMGAAPVFVEQNRKRGGVFT
jgi:hypothetical protein